MRSILTSKKSPLRGRSMRRSGALFAALGIALAATSARHDASGSPIRPAAQSLSEPVHADPAPSLDARPASREPVKRSPEPTTVSSRRLTSSASAHLPAGCMIAARIAWKELRAQPRGRQLADLLFARLGALPGAGGVDVTTGIRALGVDLDRDLTDLALCAIGGISPGSSDVFVALGGTFPERILSAVPVEGTIRAAEIRGERTLQMGPRSWNVQAPDGALLFGTSRNAIEAGGWAKADDNGFPRGAPLALRMEHGAVRKLLQQSLGPFADSMESITVTLSRRLDSFEVVLTNESDSLARQLVKHLEPLLKTASPPLTSTIRGREATIRGAIEASTLESLLGSPP